MRLSRTPRVANRGSGRVPARTVVIWGSLAATCDHTGPHGKHHGRPGTRHASNSSTLGCGRRGIRVIEYRRHARRVPGSRPDSSTPSCWRSSPVALVILTIACRAATPTSPADPIGFAGTNAVPAAVVAGTTAGVSAIPAPGPVAGSSPVAAGPPIGASALQGPTWPAANASCGDIGQDCGNRLCAPTTVCSSGPTLCLPRPAAAATVMCKAGTCPAGQPYCVASQCMSAEDAACVCGFAAGKMRVDACKVAPSVALGPMDTCFDEESLCSSAPQKCCPGLTCVQSPSTLGQCFKPCTANGDCAGRCCVDSNAGKVCQPDTSC